MNNLAITNHNGIFVTDSRAVAKMVGKDHKHLLRDIKGYLEILNQSNFGPVDFFIDATYQDAKGEVRPCYLLTKQGCEMVANKLTGEKGVLFTAVSEKLNVENPTFYKSSVVAIYDIKDNRQCITLFTISYNR